MARIIRGFIVPYINPECGKEAYVDVLDVTSDAPRYWTILLEYLSKGLGYLDKYYSSLRAILLDQGYDPKNVDNLLESIIGDKYQLVHDFIVWMLRAPLHRDPVKNVIISPYKLYILLRLLPINLLKLVIGEEKVDQSKLGELPENPLETLEVFLELVQKLVSFPQGKLKSTAHGQLVESIVGILRLLDDDRYSDAVEKSLLLVPADTRPGFNTVNLITHLVLVSSIAWTLGASPRELLAALLHDIGKPLNPENHVEKSVEEAQKLLRNLKNMFTEDEISKILDIIESHHVERNVVSQADQIAAGERNLELVRELLSDKVRAVVKKVVEVKGLKGYEKYIEDPVEVYRLTGPEGWKFWNSVDVSDLVELTKTFVNNARTLPMTKADAKGGRSYTNIKVALVDFRNIQDTVYYTDNLRMVIAASYVVDYLVIAYMPVLLYKKLNMPLSAIVFNAGGALLLVIPEVLEKRFSSLLNEFNKLVYSLLGLTIAYTIESFNTNYVNLSRSIMSSLTYKKISDIETIMPDIVSRGFEKPCEICGLRPVAVDQNGKILEVELPEGRKPVCHTCKHLYEIGKLLHFNAKLGLGEGFNGVIVEVNGRQYVFKELYKELDPKKLDELVPQYLIEYHSGWDPDSGLARQLNYAIIAIDGNLMSVFMRSALSFSDAVERSVRIDLALKKALANTLKLISLSVKDACLSLGLSEETCRQYAARELLRLYSGVLYMGGDDARIICPAWASIPLSIGLITYFYHYMGGYSTLSIGLASAPPKHSIWGLIRTASKLEDEAKSKGRSLSVDIWLNNTTKGVGAIAFIQTESTSMLTPSKTEFLLGESSKQRLSIQPYIVGIHGKGELTKILSLCFDKVLAKIRDEPIRDKELVEFLSKECSIADILKLIVYTSKLGFYAQYSVKHRVESTTLKSELNEYMSTVKKIRDVVNELLEQYLANYTKVENPKISLMIALVYAKRQASRTKGVTRNVYELIMDIASSLAGMRTDYKGGVLPLHDLYMLVKILGGGAI